MRNKAFRCRFGLFLVCFALCFATVSCRTYLGSDDLYKQKSGEWKVIKTEQGSDQKKGVSLSTRGNTSLRFEFLIKSYDRKVQEQSIYESTRKRYYFVNPNDFLIQDPSEIIILPLWITICLPVDALYSLLNYDYHYRGKNRPGLFYQIAYLPFIRYFFQAFLFAPNSLYLKSSMGSYREKKSNNSERMTDKQIFESFVRTEEVYNSPKRIQIRQQEVYSTAVLNDNSNSTVKITAGDKNISKKVSPDGIMELDLSEIGPVAFDRQNTIKFKIHHVKWKMDWSVEVPATLDPEVIRDWNIFVDEQYDYRTRSLALTRLKTVLGETSYKDYLSWLLDDRIDKRALSPMPTEIQIVPLQ